MFDALFVTFLTPTFQYYIFKNVDVQLKWKEREQVLSTYKGIIK